MKYFTMQPVGGAAFQMLKDGSVRVALTGAIAERFKLGLLRLAEEVHGYAVDELEKAKNLEVVGRVLPKTRIQQLEDELARLKAAEVVIPLHAQPSHLQPPIPFPAGGMIPPPAIPNFDEDAARSQTITRGGFEPDDGQLVRPTGTQL